MVTKTCRICGGTFSMENFYRFTHNYDGFDHRCKQCTRAQVAAARERRLTCATERPSPERLRELFLYDPETGEIKWRVSPSNSIKAGEIAGWIEGTGYQRIRVGERAYPATNIIWAMQTGEWPSLKIDHIDTCGPKANWGNRWGNLRLATNSQNGHNRAQSSLNSSGHRGVSWAKRNRRWSATIVVNGQAKHLGFFLNIEDAINARLSAEKLFIGEYAPRAATPNACPVPDDNYKRKASSRPALSEDEHRRAEAIKQQLSALLNESLSLGLVATSARVAAARERIEYEIAERQLPYGVRATTSKTGQ